ncbi:hypothetical protein BCR33DRAFT_713218 [Rhizoclosmatium globosum]|uniref:Uncharacterized protein n=1 Tax=Rhizoclosmatium globosum TaxID=329046 RepID=A0A1Y2CTT3_9FUNG|nr:hypothetical protein BCR33DRAFT_713218 [Rhizoclosmatium globosum]|eukprot:ORY50402.1 hypothetical protein BCR33DRAFT_713218 [Rhizoclosmatium globosum]
MAAVEEDGGDVRRRAEEANEVKLKIRSLEVQVDELKEQVRTELDKHCQSVIFCETW